MPNGFVLEVALDPIQLPLDAAQVPGRGRHELQPGARRSSFVTACLRSALAISLGLSSGL